AAHGGMPRILVNIRQPRSTEPAGNFLRRMDAVKARRVAVKGVQHVVLNAESLVREWEQVAQVMNESAVWPTPRPGHEHLTEAVVPLLRNAARERNPLGPRGVIAFVGINPNRDFAARLEQARQ